MGSTIPLVGVVIITGMLLYQYSIWIFQSINQLMRVRLIDQLQMQSLAYHSQAQTGDAIYRVYQDSAMVTSIIRSIFLDPLMFLGRYMFGLGVVAAFSPWLALILGITILPCTDPWSLLLITAASCLPPCPRAHQQANLLDPGEHGRHSRH
jgi:ABC-type multidrug transport system fused ATPase/permease subunit